MPGKLRRIASEAMSSVVRRLKKRVYKDGLAIDDD